MRKSIVIVAVALASLFALLFAWRSIRTAPPARAAPPPTAVAALVVRAEALPASLDAVGTVRAVREVMLAPETAGRVVEIRFEAGDRVAAGDPIVKLFDAPERADRAAAQARATLAKLELARSQELASTGAETHELLEQRQAEMDQALASIQQLDAHIAQKIVRAPFAGELGIRQVNPGQYLNAGDPLATLTAVDPLYVNFSIPQQELARVTVGAVVQVSADAWPGRAFSARVNAIEPVIGTDTRNVSVQALLPNPDRLLRPGMYVTARLLVAPQPDGIAVPATAIQTSASGDSVVLIRGPNRQHEGVADVASVQTGRRIGDRVVVTQGLTVGDVVVSEGQLRVQPGAKVTVSRLIEPNKGL